MDNSNTTRKAEAEIMRLEFPLPTKPGEASEILEWPRNIADLSYEELANHMTWWSGWSGYARYHLAYAETNVIAYNKERKLREAEIMQKLRGTYDNVTELKAAILPMKEIKEIDSLILQAEAIVMLTKALLEGFEDKYKTVSREISRRSADFTEKKWGM